MRRGLALAARGCRLRAICRPPRRLSRDKPRPSPGCRGNWPAGYGRRRRHRRRCWPRRRARTACPPAVRRTGISLLAVVTRYGHMMAWFGAARRLVITRWAGVACGGRRVPVARSDPATEPSSKANQHDDHGGPSRASSPQPCSCRQLAAAVPAHLPDESSAVRRVARARHAKTTCKAGLWPVPL